MTTPRRHVVRRFVCRLGLTIWFVGKIAALSPYILVLSIRSGMTWKEMRTTWRVGMSYGLRGIWS